MMMDPTVVLYVNISRLPWKEAVNAYVTPGILAKTTTPALRVYLANSQLLNAGVSNGHP